MGFGLVCHCVIWKQCLEFRKGRVESIPIIEPRLAPGCTKENRFEVSLVRLYIKVSEENLLVTMTVGELQQTGWQRLEANVSDISPEPCHLRSTVMDAWGICS